MFQTHIPVDFLRDESRKCGTAEAIAFPRSTAELVAAVREAAVRGKPITLQGSRTGISAGAVPDGGVIVNLSKMDRILNMRTDVLGHAFLRVQAGLPLIALRRHLATMERAGTETRPYVFLPDPTETSASGESTGSGARFGPPLTRAGRNLEPGLAPSPTGCRSARQSGGRQGGHSGLPCRWPRKVGSRARSP